MHQGYSWSGRERNCCYLNLGDGTFSTYSATSGLDFPDDGRAVAVCDWDGDGDLDLWLKNRTGPQLRFMQNGLSSGEPFLELRLVGKTCNRDAVGAVVEVEADGRRLIRTVTCGDGYLSQSSKRLHFGLGQAESIDRVAVKWPGGTSQTFAGLIPNRRYRLEQGSDAAIEVSGRSLQLSCSPASSAAPPGKVRMILRAPLPLPPSIVRGVLDRNGSTAGTTSKRATLICLWAHWCEPCLVELGRLAERNAVLQREGLDIVAVNLDAPADREKADRWFESSLRPKMGGTSLTNLPASDEWKESLDAIFTHIRDQGGAWPLPASVLVDGDGALQIGYFGPVDPDKLVADVRVWGSGTGKGASRSAYPGRWYFKIPRDFAGLARDLERRGRFEDAAFYTSLTQRDQAGP
jgi:hypothetical protein